MGLESNEEEVEMSLLGEEERRQAANGLVDSVEEYGNGFESKRSVSAKDKRGMVLLCVLCTSSSIPLESLTELGSVI
jgi:PAT family acetyl-CoA transporter-like MFS transporter 1